MSKITYSSLKLKTNEDIKTFKFEDKEIEVKQYITMKDAIDLVEITLQKSKEGRIYNPLKVDMYYHLHLIYLMTNISFTDKQRENEDKLYDALLSNGIVDNMVANLPQSIYEGLLNKIEEKIDIELKYNTTAAAIISNIIEELPQKSQEAVDIMNQFNPEQFANVINFAKAANGGRDI
jgi:hypothetical protein